MCFQKKKCNFANLSQLLKIPVKQLFATFFHVISNIPTTIVKIDLHNNIKFYVDNFKMKFVLQHNKYSNKTLFHVRTCKSLDLVTSDPKTDLENNRPVCIVSRYVVAET